MLLPVVFAYDPAAHGVQTLAVCSEKVPLEQMEHTDAPLLEK